ncbi:MAG: hypothetical protein MUF85_03325 [Patescibacteria group bacterium]|jgi:hypothetical protein|nr:hypothetical protein [Patescibacteria group bacterium]
MVKRKVKKQSKKIKITKPLKPEKTISAKPKNNKNQAKTPKQLSSLKLSKSYIWYVVLAGIILLAVTLVYGQYSRANNAVNDANKSKANHIQIDKQYQIVGKIGTNKQLLQNTINYQSLPVDSYNTVIKEIRKSKSNCISNKDLVANYSFEIKNVVYDKFILAEYGCNGKNQLIIAKLDTGWAVVNRGNNLMECNSVYSLGLPAGVAEYCLTGGVKYLNPNP